MSVRQHKLPETDTDTVVREEIGMEKRARMQRRKAAMWKACAHARRAEGFAAMPARADAPPPPIPSCPGCPCRASSSSVTRVRRSMFSNAVAMSDEMPFLPPSKQGIQAFTCSFVSKRSPTSLSKQARYAQPRRRRKKPRSSFLPS